MNAERFYGEEPILQLAQRIETAEKADVEEVMSFFYVPNEALDILTLLRDPQDGSLWLSLLGGGNRIEEKTQFIWRFLIPMPEEVLREWYAGDLSLKRLIQRQEKLRIRSFVWERSTYNEETRCIVSSSTPPEEIEWEIRGCEVPDTECPTDKAVFDDEMRQEIRDHAPKAFEAYVKPYLSTYLPIYLPSDV